MGKQLHNRAICAGDCAIYAPSRKSEYVPFCGKVTFNRGKLKGKPIADAPDEYLAWLQLKAKIDTDSQVRVSQEIDRRDRAICRSARKAV